MYKCECGKEFETANSFNGHKSHCLQHLKAVGKDKEFLERLEKYKQNFRRHNKLYSEQAKLKKDNKENKIRICKRCKKEYTWKNSNIKSKDFCSRSCANKRIITPEIKEKIGKSNKTSDKTNYYKSIKELEEKRKQKYYNNPNKCEVCGEILDYSHRKYKACCKECRSELIRKSALNQKYHGFGKQGRYKSFWCDSTWELAYVIYCLDHNINIKRNTKSYQYTYNGKIHRYLPDFIVDNKLVEIKGYYTELVDIKAKAVNDLPLIILYEKDLKEYFDWVKNNYSYKNLEDLYDNAP